MDYTKKPTVFILGERKKDAPPEREMTREEMEKHLQNARKYIRDERK